MYVMHNANNINGAEDRPSDTQILMAKEEELKGEQDIKDEQLAKYTGKSAEKFEMNQKTYMQRQKLLSKEQARKKAMQSTEEIHKSKLLKETQNEFDAVLDLKRQRQATLEEESKQEYIDEGKEKGLEAGNKPSSSKRESSSSCAERSFGRKTTSNRKRMACPKRRPNRSLLKRKSPKKRCFPLVLDHAAMSEANTLVPTCRQCRCHQPLFRTAAPAARAHRAACSLRTRSRRISAS
jgi:hypothetical protein